MSLEDLADSPEVHLVRLRLLPGGRQEECPGVAVLAVTVPTQRHCLHCQLPPPLLLLLLQLPVTLVPGEEVCLTEA